MKCILHIGAPKTGTTSIQNYLNTADNLIGSNVHYVSAGRQFGAQRFNRHIGLLFSVYPIDQTPPAMMGHVGLTSREARIDYSEAFVAELEEELKTLGDNATIIISDEELFNFATEEIAEKICSVLRTLFAEIEIWAYIRNPVSYLSSAYIQSIRMGNSSSAREFSEKLLDETLYLKPLSMFSSRFGQETITIDWYTGSNVVTTLSEKLSLRPPADDDLRFRNESMSASALEVLRHINKLGPHELPLQLLLRDVCDKIKGPKWTVSQDLAQYILDRSIRELDTLTDTYRIGGASESEIRSAWMQMPQLLEHDVSNNGHLEKSATALFQRIHASVQSKLTGYVLSQHPWIL
jgi:hypothetical protein